jgi:DNA repair exonuclease SbcCD nuclease subunit
MPGVPWGGVARRAAALQNQYTAAGQPIDLFALGHFHTRNLVESTAGLIAMNGSVKGVDEYSLRSFGSGRAPGQLLLTYHPRNGLTDASFIDLEAVAPAGEK